MSRSTLTVRDRSRGRSVRSGKNGLHIHVGLFRSEGILAQCVLLCWGFIPLLKQLCAPVWATARVKSTSVLARLKYCTKDTYLCSSVGTVGLNKNGSL